MSHNIYKSNFAGITPGWHKIGHPLAVGTTAKQAMEIAGQANWSVRAVPLATWIIPSMEIDTKDMYLLVRDEDGKAQIASDQLVEHAYTPISNEDIFGPMVELLAGSNLPVDCAGVLGRLGNRAFMTFNAGSTEVDGSEKYQKYIVAIANHSGRDASLLLSTGIRVVCENTEMAAKRQAEAARKMLTIRHNKVSIDAFYENADTARQIVGLSEHYQRNLEQMAEEMQAIQFSSALVAETLRQFKGFIGKGETDREKLNRDNAAKALKESFFLEMHRADELKQPYYSLWTAKQAVSTYTQHLSRGGENMRAKRSMKMAEGIEPKMMTDLHQIVGNIARAMCKADSEKVDRALAWIGA